MQLFDQQPNVSYTCGYCMREVTVPIHSRWLENDRGAHVAICSNCRRVSIFNVTGKIGPVTRPDGVGDTIRDVESQVPQPEIVEYPPSIVPEPVARRFRDTQRAMQRELWEQAISTARTAVQVMARLEEVKRGTLYQEIERLIEKRGAELPGLVKQMAHRIRDAGNEALHPDDPDWAPTKEEAAEAFAFLQATIEWLYAMPGRLKQAEEEVEESEGESLTSALAADGSQAE